MKLDTKKFAAARGASGMTFDQIATASGAKSPTTYISHEKEPGEFRLKEIVGIYGAMNKQAQNILREAVMDIFLPD